MKIICDCGEVTEFIDDEEGASYTSGEGWYKKLEGSINIEKNHYQVFFTCSNCDAEIWIF